MKRRDLSTIQPGPPRLWFLPGRTRPGSIEAPRPHIRLARATNYQPLGDGVGEFITEHDGLVEIYTQEMDAATNARRLFTEGAPSDRALIDEVNCRLLADETRRIHWTEWSLATGMANPHTGMVSTRDHALELADRYSDASYLSDNNFPIYQPSRSNSPYVAALLRQGPAMLAEKRALARDFLVDLRDRHPQVYAAFGRGASTQATNMARNALERVDYILATEDRPKGEPLGAVGQEAQNLVEFAACWGALDPGTVGKQLEALNRALEGGDSLLARGLFAGLRTALVSPAFPHSGAQQQPKREVLGPNPDDQGFTR